MATTITPSTGAGALFTQQGVGASPGYTALDLRRAALPAITQGPVGAGAYAVSQRGAGANMSVDIASTSGSIAIAGTTIANQGLYLAPPHSAVINEAIAAADPTNPRVDQVIIRVYDNALDSTGNNRAETAVLTGTPTSGATLANRSGATALPANSYRLADVLVPAGSSTVTNANIKDRRPKTRGKANISTSESRTNVAYGTLATPDQVNEVVLPTDGLICVAYEGTWQNSVSNGARAAIFLSANQVGIVTSAASPSLTAGEASGNANVTTDTPITSYYGGLQASSSATPYTGDLTTGQTVGFSLNGGGPCYIFAAAGTYDVSVQFKASSGSVTAKNRKLWVWTLSMDEGCVF